MKIFDDNAFISASAAQDFATTLLRTRQNHMGPLNDSPYYGGINSMLNLEQKIGAEGVTRSAPFEQTMLKALDSVSGQQQFASQLQQEAIINPDSIDIHDITIAQSLASMSLSTTRNILSRLVQSWRDIINTR
ncbi:MAG: flagellar hook-basal body complex protein FliE [Treponema sp.]|nr:flagellar hook-basal body complex protein FliE [Treponema sp.]